MVGACIRIYRGVCRDRYAWYWCQGILLAVSILPSWRLFLTCWVWLWVYFCPRGSQLCWPQQWVLCDTGRSFVVKSWRKCGRTWLCVYGGFCYEVQSILYSYHYFYPYLVLTGAAPEWRYLTKNLCIFTILSIAIFQFPSVIGINNGIRIIRRYVYLRLIVGFKCWFVRLWWIDKFPRFR